MQLTGRSTGIKVKRKRYSKTGMLMKNSMKSRKEKSKSLTCGAFPHLHLGNATKEALVVYYTGI